MRHSFCNDEKKIKTEGKMKNFIFMFILFLFTLTFAGCEIDEPSCRIVNYKMNFPEFGFAKMEITVVNGGAGTAYGIECSIRLKSNNYIVDESSALLWIFEAI